MRTVEGVGRTQRQAAGVRQSFGHPARPELLFQDRRGRYFYENEGGCHAQRSDEAQLQPSDRYRAPVHYRFCTLPKPHGYTDHDTFPAILFKQV